MRGFLFAVVVSASACSTTSSGPASALPFRVGVIPVGHVEREAVVSEGVKLRLDQRALAARIAEELDDRVFTVATLLPLPEGVSPKALSGWETEARDAYWISAADAAGVDVLLEWEASFPRHVTQGINEKFWLNLPLFLLGGPACWFVNDRSYQVEARLHATFFDLPPLLAGVTTLQEGGSRLGEIDVRIEEAQLDFLDRAGKSAAWITASFFVPPGLLAKSSESAERGLSEALAQRFAQGLADRVEDDPGRILRAEQVVDYYLTAGSRAEWSAEGTWFEGEVLVRLGDGARLEEWELEGGGVSVRAEGGVGEPAPDVGSQRDRYLRHRLRLLLPGAERSETVRLHLHAGGRNPTSRTYTLAVSTGTSLADARR